MNRAQRFEAQIAHIEENRDLWEQAQGKNADVAEYMYTYGSYERWDLYQRVCDDIGIEWKPEICHPDPED